MFKRALAFLSFSLFFLSYLLADTITVTNTYDSGTGSLRQAILDANANIEEPDSIIFHIPKTDPNYVDSSGVWLIRPDSGLPKIVGNGVTIDGRSQKQFTGSDTNPNGPEIVLDGINVGVEVPGIKVTGEVVRIWCLVVHNFSSPNIWFDHGSKFCQVAGCYIGTNVTGMKRAANAANGLWGIYINGGIHCHIGPIDGITENVISGNLSSEIILSNNAKHNTIVGNTIGLTVDRKTGIGYDSKGISIQQFADSNLVADNYIGGNSDGIALFLYASHNEVVNNFIGTDTAWEDDFHNFSTGVKIWGEAKNNLIAENVIGKNKGYGISISDEKATGNTFSHNYISENGGGGIKNFTGLISPPTILQVTSNLVSGTAPGNSQVEIYTDPEDQGRFFIGQTMADASGNFNWNGNLDGEYVTAIAIDDSGNTSEFSPVYVYTNVPQKIKFTEPVKFDLFQNYPNPFNPNTTIKYNIAKTTKVILKIYNLQGQEIECLVDGIQNAGIYSLSWDGTNNQGNFVNSGVYICHLSTGNLVKTHKMLLIK